MNTEGQACREKVAIVAGDAPFLISKPLLQRMGAVLDLEQRQLTFNKFGGTLDLEESATGHCVIDLIPGCADLTSDDAAQVNVHGPVRLPRGASVKDSATSVETREFSNLLCGSENVTIIDVDKPRVSLVEVDFEKSCRRWTLGNFVSDKGVFVVKEECHKNQQMLLPVPWTGRTIIEKR